MSDWAGGSAIDARGGACLAIWPVPWRAAEGGRGLEDGGEEPWAIVVVVVVVVVLDRGSVEARVRPPRMAARGAEAA